MAKTWDSKKMTIIQKIISILFIDLIEFLLKLAWYFKYFYYCCIAWIDLESNVENYKIIFNALTTNLKHNE
jgi:hypothetical protein